MYVTVSFTFMPTESYYFLVKQVYKLLKRKNHILIHTQRAKLEVPEKKHVNKKNQSGITSINEDKSESVNVTCTCDSEANEHKNTSSTHDNEREGKTSSTYDKEY